MAGAAGALGRVPRASLSAPRAEGDGIGRPPGTATAFGEATAVVPRDAALAGIELLGPARPYCERLKDLGVLCKETHDHVIRLAPPLIISQEDLFWLSAQLRAAFAG